MSEIRYRVVGPGYDGRYGILAVDSEGKHTAAAMPFLRREDTERLAGKLRVSQMPVSQFCDAFIDGSLMKMT